ncbi:hypothetical protein BBB39_04160 [Bordetella trematum]|uniref:Membrane protein n=5 Tax=Bordetella trematum TaxID=123899 RepID=A0A157SI32_9BORD|nr:DUF802 domain-containing protein [Bordetella trematum]AZR93063.1 hypothetical protein BBB39_04160 [Bordetella trematum]SAI70118.1 membrane protein [Bordetella trematum]SUV98936.1 membrane protein [Bordetella trematum]
MNRLLHLIVFLAGLAAIVWIGAGYVGTNPLALAVTTLIGVCYLAGAIELARYHQTTLGLTQALQSLSAPVATLDDWIARVPAGLRTAVRLRVEGGRASLPAPALAPYLVGLLVLLGMLGTFLGMVATLRGTALALDGSTDLQAMRASLAAPVKGLGFAFGTSVAGVAASAMLGLLSALCRRARLQASQSLDTAAATSLHAFSQAHQRAENLQLMRAQADSLPVLAERLQTMMDNMERQSRALNERLQAGQDAFHGKTEAVYGRLADSVQNALTHSVAESAQAAGTAIQPAVAHAMQTLAQESTAWRESISQAMQQQLDHLSARLEQTSATLAEQWRSALAEQQQANQALNQALGGTLREAADTLQGSASQTAQSWSQALAQQQQSNQTLQQTLQGTLEQFASGFDARANQLLTQAGARLQQAADTLGQSTEQTAASLAQALAAQQAAHQSLNQDLRGTLEHFTSGFDARADQLLTQAGARLQQAADTLGQSTEQTAASLAQALAAQQAAHQSLNQDLRGTLEHFTSGFDARADQLLTQAGARLQQAADTLGQSTEQTAASLAQALAAQQAAHQSLNQDLRGTLEHFTSGFDARADQLLTQAGARLQQAADTLGQSTEQTAASLAQALAAQQAAHQSLNQDLRGTLEEFASGFDARTSALVGTVSSQLSDSTTQIAAATAAMTGHWRQALDSQQTAQQAQAEALEGALARFGNQFEERSQALVQRVAQRLDDSAATVSGQVQEALHSWQQALQEQQQNQGALTDRMAQALAQVAADFEQRSASLLTDMSARLDGTARAVAEGTAGALQDWHAALQAQQQTQQAQAETQRDALQAHTQAFAARSAEMAAEIAARMDQSAGQLAELWQQALARHEAAGQALLQAQQLAQQANADRFAEQSQALLATVDQAHGRLHGELAARDEARLSAWTTSLAGVAAALRTEWEDTGTRTLARQQEICDRFAAAVHDITTQAEHQSRQTIGEIERLLEAASQAPKAATEMLAELRQQLSDSLARDNAMLQERGHLLQTVDTLLAAINHASGEQRQAIDALVAASAELMGRASEQFAAQVEDKARQLNETAGQIEGAAVEVASLGEAFGAAVAHFGQANEKLLIQLERIEGALGQSLARSDEQLAYYVAQAREVVDLSMLSQKQILQELQQIKREGGDAA